MRDPEGDDWRALLERPATATDEATADAWFQRVATRLLQETSLEIGGVAHRVVELELYYHGPPHHPDPFTHQDPLQQSCGRWYLHRTGAGLRGGTYKGIDLTFGEQGVCGGALLRALEAPDGALIEGPSLCVDHMIARAGAADVAALDRAVADRDAWSEGQVIRLRRDAAGDARPIFRSGRVGLTLRRADEHPGMLRTIGRLYRFLTAPTGIKKGRPYLIAALRAQGRDAKAIAATVGSPEASVRKLIAEFDRGHAEDDATLAAYRGRSLSSGALARMLGAWQRHYG
ncbi:MAG: hypothetical protein KC636_25530 [Myxococcales bacterium]|nr:hypothetical protein [Myxococcales bacterium]